MGRANGRRGKRFQGEIARRNGIHTIAHGPVKAQGFRRHMPVRIKTGSGQSGGS